MKLKQISESFILQKLRDQLTSSGFFNRPVLQSTPLYQASSGHDAGSRTTGYTSLATGVPRKARHRRFLGFSQRPGAIYL